MGLIKALTNAAGGIVGAGAGALGGVLADQWKEYFYCEAMPADVLVTKGIKKTSSRGVNNKATDNIISSGSVIAIADGQCMIIVEQGKVVELCAEPGEFTYDASTEPSLFCGGLNKENIKKNFANVGKRFTFGGEAPKDQRVYYFNTKEILGNKYGTQNPVPFRIVDNNIGLDFDSAVRCNGEYSYKIVDPLMFYTNVCGNIPADYKRSEIDSQLKSELLTALQPTFAKISEMGIRYSALPGHADDLAKVLNEVLSEKWLNLRGIAIYSFGVNSVTISEDDEKYIKDLQRAAVFRNAGMAGAGLVDAQRQAMVDAANNAGGAALGFMGMNVAQGAVGNAAANFFQMDQQNQQSAAAAAPAAPAAPAAGWTCACGSVNTGKFCAQCGQPKPEAQGWTCACGAVNQGKFCPQCGKQKPEGAPLYKCDKCGWKPEDPHNPPKFCPECGDPFNELDKQ